MWDQAPADWRIADKTEWVSDKLPTGEINLPPLEGREVVGFSEKVSFAGGQYIPDNIKKAAAGLPNYTYTNPTTGQTYLKKNGHWTISGQNGREVQRRMGNAVDRGQVPEEHVDRPKSSPRSRPQSPQVSEPEKPTKPEPERHPSQKSQEGENSNEPYRSSEAFNKSTRRTNEEFLNDPPNELVNGAKFIDVRRELSDSGLFPDGVNFPPAYLDLISQLRITKKGDIPVSDYIEGAGAGQIRSQVGELMTMASTSMSDAQAEKFFEILSRDVPNGSCLDESWIVAAKRNRDAIYKSITNNLGGGEIVAASWDVKNEVEALGKSYAEKGFSTDVFFKVRTASGKEEILEVSLKKDKNVFFINGGAQSLAEQAIMAMPGNSPIHQKLQSFNEKETELRNTKGVKAKRELRDLLKNKAKFLKEHTSDYNSDVYMDDLVENVYQPAAVEILRSPNSLREVENIFKQNPKMKSLITDLKADSLQHALQIIANTSPDDAGEAHYKLLAKVFEAAKNSENPDQLLAKYARELDGRYRKYQRGMAEELSKDSPLRNAVVGNIRKEFPLKAVLNGQEVMAIGDASFDLKTAERIFGTTDINKINQGLSIKVDKNGSPMLVYSAGQEGSEIAIATITVRQKGKGYASMGFEAALHPEFYNALEDANIKENHGGVKRKKYNKAEERRGPFDPNQHRLQHQTMSEKTKLTAEDYLQILRNKKNNKGPKR